MLAQSFSPIALAIALLSYMASKAAVFREAPPRAEATEIPDIDGSAAAARLSGAIKFRTVSYENREQAPAAEFAGLHRHILDSFPKCREAMKIETVNGLSLLLEWTGRNAALPPLLFSAHQDVVPAPEEPSPGWTHGPFSGDIADGHVWGRGALDMKSGLFALLEAAESLITHGFVPERTVYFAFGHDEEIGGLSGAAKISELLSRRGIRLACVFDEGGAIRTLPEIPCPVGFIGISEKGYATVELTARGAGGHSAVPGNGGAIASLCSAVTKVEKMAQPVDLGPILRLFKHIGRVLPYGRRFLLANSWLFAPFLRSMLSRTPEMNAMIRTTAAPTIISGGIKENIIPDSARVVINFRLIPGDSAEKLVERVKKAVDDPRIEVTSRFNFKEPPPVSPVDSFYFRSAEEAIYETCGESDFAVAPFIMLGASDSRHYVACSDAIYRFQYLKLLPEDARRVHGTDERISVSNYVEAIGYYMRLLVKTSSI